MTTCPKHILDFWEAYDRVEALPSPWQQTAEICAQVESVVGIQYAKQGVKDYKPKTKASFMPPNWKAPKTVIGPPQTDEELDQVIKKIR